MATFCLFFSSNFWLLNFLQLNRRWIGAPLGRSAIFSADHFLFDFPIRLDTIFRTTKTNLVQNVPTKQNLFSKFARNVKIKNRGRKNKRTRAGQGLRGKTKQTDKAFVS